MTERGVDFCLVLVYNGFWVRPTTQVRAGMPSSLCKEVRLMDNEYIISFMLILLLLVISIKK